MADIARGRGSGKVDRYPVPYSRNFGPEQLKELYGLIERHHLDFLSLDGDRKAESLRLLKAYAAEFLFQVSHSQKFKFPNTEAVLSQSIGSISRFDSREASLAFEDLAKYANNLLEQPWRREFHRLKTTSGFFVHNIRANLKNPQEILVLLGYVATDDYTLELALSQDPVTLAAVSRDCYIASQECMILGQILDRVISELPDYPITIQEVYLARKLLMGDTTTVVKHLIHEARIIHDERQESMKSEAVYPPRHLNAEPYTMKHVLHQVNHFVPSSYERVQPSTARLYSNSSKTNGLKHASVLPAASASTTHNNGNHYQSQALETPTSALRQDSSSTSRSSSSPRSPNSCTSLKELEEVFLQTYLQNQNQVPQHSENGSDLSKMLDSHHHHINQVEELKQQRYRVSQGSQPQSKQNQGRRSEFGTQSTRVAAEPARMEVEYSYDVVDGKKIGAARSRTTLSTTSGFKGLKHHQDLPKLPTTTNVSNSCSTSPGPGNGGFLGKIKGTLGGKNSKQDKADQCYEKDPNYTASVSRKSLALTKSKVPNDFDPELRGSGILDKTGRTALPSNPPEESVRQSNGERRSPVPVHQSHFIAENDYRDRDSTSPDFELVTESRVPWRCPHCTYDNRSSARICEMCSKSKDFVLED